MKRTHQGLTDMEMDENSRSDTELYIDQIKIADTDKLNDPGFGKNFRPTLLPMISSRHVITEISCSRGDPTRKISCRLIVLFLIVCSSLTFLCLIYRNFSYLKSYNLQNWDEKMREIQNPIHKIECQFQKCKEVFRKGNKTP